MLTVALVLVLILSLPGLAVGLACNAIGCDPELYPARHRDLADAPTVPIPNTLGGGCDS